MDKLIELLQQIQDLAGVAIDALQGAADQSGGGDGGGAPAPDQAPAGDMPPQQ